MKEFYKKYFEALATSSVDIQHTATDIAFFYINDKYSLKPFDDAIRSAAKTPAFLLERYTADIDDNGNENHFDHINGRFSILIKTERGNRQSEEDADELAENIAKKIIKKMRKDLKDMVPFTIGDLTRKVQFKIQRVSIDPIGPIAGEYYGVTVGFLWRCPLSVAVQEADWT